MTFGIARDLRKEEADLNSASSLALITAYAYGLTFSLSGTERLHATNRAFCVQTQHKAGFDAMAASAVNKASLSSFRADKLRLETSAARSIENSENNVPNPVAQQQQSLVVAHPFRPRPRPPVPKAKAKAKSEARLPMPKGKSAIEVFRAEFIDKRRKAGLSVKNAVSREMWAEVKAFS